MEVEQVDEAMELDLVEELRRFREASKKRKRTDDMDTGADEWEFFIKVKKICPKEPLRDQLSKAKDGFVDLLTRIATDKDVEYIKKWKRMSLLDFVMQVRRVLAYYVNVGKIPFLCNAMLKAMGIVGGIDSMYFKPLTGVFDDRTQEQKIEEARANFRTFETFLKEFVRLSNELANK